MNATLGTLARDKEILVARSALCRLHLRRHAQEVRDSLHWQRVVVAAATAPAMPRIALGVAIWFAGFARVARVVMLAGRIVLLSKLACGVIDHVRNQRSPAAKPEDDLHPAAF